MMWPQLSKEFSEVARLQAVSHGRGYAATCSGKILPPTDLGAELVLTQAKLWQREASAVTAMPRKSHS